MEQSHRNATDGPQVVSEQVGAFINERAARLGPAWEFQPRDIAWACNNRDWDDVFCDLLKPVAQALNRIKAWFRP
jgi:hypothetical protein